MSNICLIILHNKSVCASVFNSQSTVNIFSVSRPRYYSRPQQILHLFVRGHMLPPGRSLLPSKRALHLDIAPFFLHSWARWCALAVAHHYFPPLILAERRHVCKRYIFRIAAAHQGYQSRAHRYIIHRRGYPTALEHFCIFRRGQIAYPRTRDQLPSLRRYDSSGAGQSVA